MLKLQDNFIIMFSFFPLLYFFYLFNIYIFFPFIHLSLLPLDFKFLQPYFFQFQEKKICFDFVFKIILGKEVSINPFSI